MPQFGAKSIAVLSLCALSGCGLVENPITCNPGPTAYQVNEAKRFDPYPDPTTGPPIVGGRPLDYIDPRPEPDVTKNPRFWLAPGPNAPASLGYPAGAYPAAPAYVAPPPGATAVPVQPAATSYAPPATAAPSAVVPASAMVPVATAPSASSASSTVPAAYGTKIDEP